jgi:hypothetical protein
VLCNVKMRLKKVCKAKRKPVCDIAALKREDVQEAYCNKLQKDLEEGSSENIIDQAVERLNTAIQNTAKAALTV